MKRFFLLIIVTTVLLDTSSAQEYIPFPIENSSWYNSYYSCTDELTDCLLYWVRDYHMNGDTLINENTMTKVMASILSPWEYQDSLPPTTYIGAIREDSAQILFVPWYQTDEVLLYDFSVELGDTLHVFTLFGEEEIVVEQVYYEDFNFGGIIRKVIWHQSGFWVEGIGNIQGLFQQNYFNLSGAVFRQECIFQNGEIIYDNDWPAFNCEPLSTSETKSEISIYPNPSNGFVQIEGLNDFFAMEVIDQQGRVVLSKKFNQLQYSSRIDLRELNSGFFILRIHFEDFVSTHRIIME